MGKMIEEAALSRGHEICCVIDAAETEKFDSPQFREADVAIDFSIPSAEPENVERCFAAGVPVVCGTTGWKDSLPIMERKARNGEGTLLWSSNFSVGVNIFRAVNRYLARIMAGEPQYNPVLTEVHHIHKLDHPSGTAVTLAEDLIEADSRTLSWQDAGEEGKAIPGDLEKMAEEHILPVLYRREGEVPGIHSITWDSPQDSITITHSAHSRRGFALGAVIAADWLAGRKGLYTIEDVFRYNFADDSPLE